MVYYTQQFVFDCPPRRWSSWSTLNMTVKRYRASSIPQVDGLTLFFFHCNGGHKEHWEPVIEYLFSRSNFSHIKIREAWAFDWPSHGEAGVLNRDVLEKRTENLSVYDWVPGVVQFLRSKYIRGHHVVLCGHSAGATTAVLSASEFYPNLPSVGIIGLILIEPGIATRKHWQEDFQGPLARVVPLSSSRKDSWKSRQDALTYFQNQHQWRKWDPKVLRLYVEHGLHEFDYGTVTLSCDKKREVEGYVDMDPHVDGIACLGKLCRVIPVHLMWGERKNFIPVSAQTALSNASEGRKMASVTKIEGAGHMVVQEQPIGLARVICHILETMPCVFAERSRL